MKPHYRKLMGWKQKGMTQMKGQDKIPEKQLNEVEIGNLPRHYFSDKGLYSQTYGFSNSYVWMLELDHKESWTQRSDAFELWCCRRLLRVSWTARRPKKSIPKEINPEFHWKDWCWSWNSNTWPPDAKNWPIRKNPDAGKDWKQKEKATRGWDGWMAWPTQRAWVWAPGVGDGQGSLACYRPWCCKESDTTEWLNWIESTFQKKNSE